MNFSRDALGEELTTSDISRRELDQDKKIIKLINTACKEDKAPRAISLVKQLNHLQSIDGAIKIAEFYRLVGLKEKIELIKADREGDDRLEIARDKRREWATAMKPIPAPKSHANYHYSAVDPERPKLLEDFRPPPAIYRPGLAPATPIIETTRFSTANLEARIASSGSMSPPESKRKRDEESESASKRRALESESMGPPKPSMRYHSLAGILLLTLFFAVGNNPFARKPGQQETSRNPFARKTDPNKTIHKSESFFDKVDAAAETDKSKRMLKLR